MNHKVDFIMCIDATVSMRYYINSVKYGALSFKRDIFDAFRDRNINIKQMHAKVIAFSDIVADGSETFKISRFFNLTEEFGDESRDYRDFIYSLDPCSGYKDGKSGNALEALSLAIQSNWEQNNCHRKIIVLFTDSSSYRLEDADCLDSNYLKNMLVSLDELTDMWLTLSSLKPAEKRLILFAPQMYPWLDIYEKWDMVIYNPSNAGDQLGN